MGSPILPFHLAVCLAFVLEAPTLLDRDAAFFKGQGSEIQGVTAWECIVELTERWLKEVVQASKKICLVFILKFFPHFFGLTQTRFCFEICWLKQNPGFAGHRHYDQGLRLW